MSDAASPPRVIVITGPVGAGKTTTAELLAGRLAAAGIPSASIDLDALRAFGPRPATDRFGTEIGYANLAAVAANYRRAGVRCLVLADVVETADQVAHYAAAVPGVAVTVVRLRVEAPLLTARLVRRHADPAEREWHLARAPELDAIMTANAIGDLVIAVGDDSPAEVAARVAAACGLP